PQNKVISFHRANLATNEHWYAVVNLGHQAIHAAPYEFGVDQGGVYKVVLDSDDRRYVGESARHFATGALGDKLAAQDMSLMADCTRGAHGKPCRLALPYLGEYATVVLRRQP